MSILYKVGDVYLLKAKVIYNINYANQQLAF